MCVFSRPISRDKCRALCLAYKHYNFSVRESSGPHFVKHGFENYANDYKMGNKKAGRIADFWKKVFLHCDGSYYAYLYHLEEIEHLKHKKQEDYIPYAYLAKRTNPFPWGDGNKGFFHNPYTNWVPGVGYEKLMSEENGKGKKSN
ncbi:hypothetical protein Mgra_00009923 [Meloidogyne graminicola]|uniref:Uncharacterized protein n=1 Tax=Meloidogyne graminicola TaxID=189291 RepID=A0A8S9ZB73_9BILA|nr:hypothetical protein Mgra_00009923 [Meloidogyne graminicola]